MTPIEFHTNYVATPKKKYHEGKEPEELLLYDCPFCESDQHLFFFPSTTTWDCKKCGEKGNVHIFNQLIYNEVGRKGVQGLKEIWDLPIRVFENIRYNPLNDSWLLPTFRDGRLNNLYKVAVVRTKDKKTGEWKDAVRVMGTPSLPTTLFDWPTPESNVVWLCEGQKDKLAADAILGSRLQDSFVSVGVPGASTFQHRWAMALQDKEVVIGLDNDDPGREGIKKILSIIEESPYKPISVKKVAWPEGTPEGYDLYDAYQQHKGSAYKYIDSLLQEVVAEGVTKVTSEVIVADDSCNTFDKMMDVMGRAYHITPDLQTAMSMVLASVYSTNLDGEQVWLKIIGRPGCGKSTISKAISASEYVQSMSTFTGLFSGWKDGEEGDPSMIPLIKNKTLVVKDADALLKQANIEKIMSELRDFYDKDSTVRYGNRQSYNYQNIRSTFIMMGTQVLRRADQSFLGERLLSLEMDVTENDEKLIKSRVVENSLAIALGRPTTGSKEVMAAVKGFIGHLKDKPTPSLDIPTEYTDMLQRLSTLAANMRTQVDRDFRGKLLSPAIAELPTRIIGQLINATISLCVVFGEDTPSDETTKIIKKVIRDTINPRSHRFAICDLILDVPGISAKEIVDKTNLPKTVVQGEINDLIELEFVDVRKVKSDRPGAATRGFWLADSIRPAFEEITR